MYTDNFVYTYNVLRDKNLDFGEGNKAPSSCLEYNIRNGCGLCVTLTYLVLNIFLEGLKKRSQINETDEKKWSNDHPMHHNNTKQYGNALSLDNEGSMSNQK